METQKPSRRYHTEEFKQTVIEACRKAGASVAGVAMAHGVNANQVRRWMRERGIDVPKQHMSAQASPPEFVQLPFAAAQVTSRDIRIEIRRGNTVIKLEWPEPASGDCATWLRDWLR